MKPKFRNRAAAGRLLAAQLAGHAADPGLVVLGLARGGLPVAVEIAGRLGAALDVLVVRKLGLPCQPELAMGAIAPGGVCVLNDELNDRLDIEEDAIGVVRRQEERELERREQLYRGGRPPQDLRGRTVILVDDGIATGSTMHAAIIFVHQREAARVVVAAPVIAAGAFRLFESMVDEVIAGVVPEHLRSVSEWFEDFSPTSDEEVRRLLAIHQPVRVAP